MGFERLTTVSGITDLPTLKVLCESCGESSCEDICQEQLEYGCEKCPIQDAFSRLSAYEDSGLSPAEVQEHTVLLNKLNKLKNIMLPMVEDWPYCQDCELQLLFEVLEEMVL